MITELAPCPDFSFPDPEQALDKPNGLVAVGGDLRPERLLAAYRSGIFPWFGENDPILWWSPDPRAVFLPGRVHCSRRLKRKLRRLDYRITLNRDFRAVIEACARPRRGEPETWLHAGMQRAYRRLHALGLAHSLEVWGADGELMGGIYGIALGRIFFAESMFSAVSDGSKIALLELSGWLQKNDFRLIDAQMMTPHLRSLGAVEWPRSRFLQAVRAYVR